MASPGPAGFYIFSLFETGLAARVKTCWATSFKTRDRDLSCRAISALAGRMRKLLWAERQVMWRVYITSISDAETGPCVRAGTGACAPTVVLGLGVQQVAWGQPEHIVSGLDGQDLK